MIREAIETLTRRPFEGTPGEYVKVQVKHALPGIGAIVHGQSKRIAHTQITRDFSGGYHHMSEQRLIFGGGINKARDFLLRYQQHMCGRLRVDVAEGQAQVIFVDDLRWNFLIDDFGE